MESGKLSLQESIVEIETKGFYKKNLKIIIFLLCCIIAIPLIMVLILFLTKKRIIQKKLNMV